MGAEFGVTVREHGQLRVLQPHGMLTERTEIELRRVLTRTLLDHGQVVVDLDGFQVVRASCVTVFPAVLDHCGGWPRVRLVLCRPDDVMARVLAQRRIPAVVPVCQLLLEAEQAIERRPAVVRARTRLVCDDLARDVARRLVRDTCPKWQVDTEVQQITELVVSELVDNAVTHARTAAVLTLERDPRRLRIAVRDTGPSDGFSTAARRSPDAGRQRRPGRGLELVARLTTVWGVEIHPVGKTVWAEVAGSSPLHWPPGADTTRPARLGSKSDAARPAGI